MEDKTQLYNTIFLIVFYIIGAIINRVARGKQDTQMKELAQTLSLDYVDGNILRKPRIAGVHEGREVMIENIIRSKGQKEKKTFFRVLTHSDVQIPDSIRIHNSLSFGPITGLFSEIGDFFGVHDIPFDNSVFDDKFVVRGRDANLVKAVISPEVQEALINLGKVNLVIQDDEIIFEQEGHAPEHESRIRSILTFENTIASKIAESLASPEFAERAVEVPVPSFRRKPQPAQQTMNIEINISGSARGGRMMPHPTADIIPLRSDYVPESASPDDVIAELKRGGYYTGD